LHAPLTDQAADDLSQLGKREPLQRCCIRQRHANGESRRRPQRNHLARESAPVIRNSCYALELLKFARRAKLLEENPAKLLGL
jgi:hypothetical protein